MWVWNLASRIREEYRLRVFEGRVLWRIFVPKKDKIMRDGVKLHDVIHIAQLV
jgi:hypothetical protein